MFAYVEYVGTQGHDYPSKMYPKIKEWEEPVLIYKSNWEEIYYQKSKN